MLILQSALFPFPEKMEQSFFDVNEGSNVTDNPAPIITDPVKCVGKLKRITQHKQEPPLPNPFPLPSNFPPMVAPALKGKTQTSKTRAKSVSVLANAVLMHKSSPTSRELEDVARAAMKKWEFLGTKSGFVS